MNFHDTELRVIRHAESCGALNAVGCNPAAQTLQLVSDVGHLCDAIANGGRVHVTEDMGRVAIDMIVLCAMLDIDLAKSLETAFNKISAKPKTFTTEGTVTEYRFPPPSEANIAAMEKALGNVVLLKRDQS